MREELRRISGVPDHVGLAYAAWARTDINGKVPESDRDQWFRSLCAIKISSDYGRAFDRWKASFRTPFDRTLDLPLVSRLLVGHGNSSATDVGLTVHHTWGVPMIPGSAIKGLVAHYVSAAYGPADPDVAPWEQPDEEREYARWQGHTRDDQTGLVRRGPGAAYRIIFGASEAREDAVMMSHGLEAGRASGLVTFHDALYVPDSAEGDAPFAADVLTVHQKSYYDSPETNWPNDYDSPIPVNFLTVRPPLHMAFALSGPPACPEIAAQLLAEALRDWGIGGKTSSGYGRFGLLGGRTQSAGVEKKSAPPKARHKNGEKITVTRVEDPSEKGRVRFRADDGVLGQIISGSSPSVDIGETAQLWVANASDQMYTFTQQPPSQKPPKRSKK